jgi:homeobox protein Meis1
MIPGCVDACKPCCHVQAQYIALITAFKDHMQQHVYTDLAEAMMSCWELEQTLCNYTGN